MSTTVTYDPQHDFGPLREYLERHPEQEALPWEYMGSDSDGRAFYREREVGNRLCLVDGGRFGRVHEWDFVGDSARLRSFE